MLLYVGANHVSIDVVLLIILVIVPPPPPRQQFCFFVCAYLFCPTAIASVLLSPLTCAYLLASLQFDR